MKSRYFHRYFLIPVLILLGWLSGCELVVHDVFFDERDLVVGKYEIEEYSETEGLYFNYDLDIYKSTRYNNSVIIYNLYDDGTEVIADVYAHGEKIKIPRQIVRGVEFEGVGTFYESGELSLIYSARNVDDGAYFVDFLNASGWKYHY